MRRKTDELESMEEYYWKTQARAFGPMPKRLRRYYGRMIRLARRGHRDCPCHQRNQTDEGR